MSEFDISNLFYYMNRFDDLNPYDFEDMVAQMFYCKGWTNVELTSRSADKGRDIIGYDKKGRKVYIEVKQHQKKIGRPVIQKLHSIMVTERVDKGMVVTTSKFTPEAIEYARTANIKLMNGKKFIETCEYFINNVPRTDSYCTPIKLDKLMEDAHRTIESYIFTYPKTSINFIQKSTYLPFFYVPYTIVIATVDQDFQNPSGSFYYHMHYPRVGYIFSEEGVLLNEKFKHLKLQYATDIKNIEKQLKKQDVPLKKKATPPINRDKLRKFIQRFRTERHKYRGQNNQVYTRVCKPKLASIDIHQIFKYWQLYTAIDFKIDKYTRFRVEFEDDKIISSKVLDYPTEKKTAKNIRMCQKCQALIFKGALKSKFYTCQGCGTILCHDCIYENKWCISCAKKIEFGSLPPKKDKQAIKLLKKDFKNWKRLRKPIDLEFVKS
ncbi:MAG: restriction endonuclease [Candidatus Lokiarchaeia archaeon]